VAAVALAVPLTLGLAACGGDQKGSGYLPSAPPVDGKTTAAPLKAAPPMRLTSATFMPAMNTANKRVTSLEATGRVTFGGQVMTLKFAETIKPFALKMDMSTPDGAMKMMLVKSTMYMSAPGLTPSGKFMKLNLKDSKDPQLSSLAGLLDSADPTKMFKTWNKSSVKVSFVKSETLGTRKVDRYLVTINTAKLLGSQQVPGGVKLPKTLAYTVWMGSDHLPYRLAFSMSGMDMQITMTGYNTVGAIAPPPASKIVRTR
jgi:hypothetical protein